MSRIPVSNFLIIVLMVSIHFALTIGNVPFESIQHFVLGVGGPESLVGHIFLHGSFFHLFGNMLFLWVFGNAVCAKVGNFLYLVYFIAIGCTAGLVHLVLDGNPAIGASGAVNGVVGLYLVFFPLNNVSCLFWFVFLVRTFYLSSMWIILLWLCFDIYGAVTGATGVAYWAHLGGFGAGFALASALLHWGIIEMRDTETSFYEMLEN